MHSQAVMRALGIKVQNEELCMMIVGVGSGGNGTIELNGTTDSNNKCEGGSCDTRGSCDTSDTSTRSPSPASLPGIAESVHYAGPHHFHGERRALLHSYCHLSCATS